MQPLLDAFRKSTQAGGKWRKEMFIVRIVLTALACSLFGYSALAGPCDEPCAVEHEKGCPLENCVGVIVGGICKAFCSGTKAFPQKIQFYSNGKTIDLVPLSVKPKQGVTK
jgi:hypothetical protein